MDKSLGINYICSESCAVRAPPRERDRLSCCSTSSHSSRRAACSTSTAPSRRSVSTIAPRSTPNASIGDSPGIRAISPNVVQANNDQNITVAFLNVPISCFNMPITTSAYANEVKYGDTSLGWYWLGRDAPMCPPIPTTFSHGEQVTVGVTHGAPTGSAGATAIEYRGVAKGNVVTLTPASPPSPPSEPSAPPAVLLSFTLTSYGCNTKPSASATIGTGCSQHGPSQSGCNSAANGVCEQRHPDRAWR